MQKVIINQKSATIRATAREHLTGNWGSIILAVLCYTFLVQGIPAVINSVTPSALKMQLSLGEYLTGQSLYEFFRADVVNAFSFVTNPELSISLGGVIYFAIFVGAFTFCLKKFLINFVRKRKIEYKAAISGLRYFIKASLLSILIMIKILAWSLLLIVPGIIALINYSQAQYILSDDPSKGIMQCIKESCYLMKGNKWKFFCFYWSYIGWLLLAALVVASVLFLVVYFIGTITSIAFVFMIEMIPISIYNSYLHTGLVVFYETLIGNLIPVDKLYIAGKEIGENDKDAKND